jgi:hypothetical protein
LFLNHGEPEALKALRYRVLHELGWEGVEVPGPGEEFVLD